MAGMSPLFRRKPAPRPQAPQTPGAPQSAQSPEHSENHLVTLIRKPGCHLCDDAQLVVEKVCGDLGVPWEEKDITQDQRLHDAYWEQIPVVLVDGRQHTFWRVNEERLRKALTDQYK
ncbi:glutaredoxin family protein [Streptomyces rochei]|uniref:glutaredoxin family protein n=1 Tax=Streptomyces rochei TaxID=1928 RepID=UPI00379A7F6C